MVSATESCGAALSQGHGDRTAAPLVAVVASQQLLWAVVWTGSKGREGERLSELTPLGRAGRGSNPVLVCKSQPVLATGVIPCSWGLNAGYFSSN